MKMQSMKGMVVLVATMMMFAGEAVATGGGYQAPPPKPQPTPTPTVNVPVNQHVDVTSIQETNVGIKVPVSVTTPVTVSTPVHVEAGDVKVPVHVATGPTNVTTPVTINEGPTTIEGSKSTSTIADGAVRVTANPVANGGQGGAGGAGGQGGQGGSANVGDVKTGDVSIEDNSQVLSIAPHAPFVNGIPTPTLFEHKMSQSGVSVPYLVEMARVCPPTFGASRDMRPQDEKGASRLSTVTGLSYRPGAFGKARDSGPPVGVLEVGGFSGTQRFRCLGRVSAEGAPKKAEKAYFDTLMYDASEFTSRRARASRVYLLFDRCTVSTSNGVMTFGRGMGASGGASDVFDSALATLNGGVSVGSGRTLTFTQVGVTFIAVEPTNDTGPGTFTLADLQPKVAQAGTTTPSGMAKPGDLAQVLPESQVQ